MTHLILLTIIISAAFAVYEAWLIAKRIKAGDREELDHAELMVWRAAAWLTGAALLMAFDAVTWRVVLLSIVPCLAAFAMMHRFTLNKARKITWWWMGLGLGWRDERASKYDTLWHKLAWWISGMRREEPWMSFAGDPVYPDNLPAKLAYGFEAAIIVVTVLLHHLP